MKLIITFATFISCLVSILVAQPVEMVTIVRDSGISIRSHSDEIIGQVYPQYSYPVLEKRPAYYFIELPNKKRGWIYANAKKGWTSEAKGIVNILSEPGINVRKEPFDLKAEIVGFVPTGYSYKILDTQYSHVKVQTPGDVSGWIYVGTSTDRWVSYSQEKIFSGLKTTFEPTQSVGDFVVKYSGADLHQIGSRTVFRLYDATEAYATFGFVKSDKLTGELILKQRSAPVENAVVATHAQIDIVVNGKKVVQGLTVNSASMHEVKVNIADQLMSGNNVIKITYLSDSKSHYWLESMLLL